MRNFVYRLIVISGLLLSWGNSHAVIEIEIDEGVERGIPIAIVPFGGDSSNELPYSIDEIIRDDLIRTGRFDPLPSNQFLSYPATAEAVRFTDWQLINADYVLIGLVEKIEQDKHRVITRLYDSFEQKQIFGVQHITTANQVRQVAHSIANHVFENITGKLSSFNTPILYTTTVANEEGGKPEHHLYISDYDGFNPKLVLRSDYPILSPALSPDSSHIVYAELGDYGSKIFVQSVATGDRSELRVPEGRNTATSWSPDGQRIAFSNNRDGNSDIYIYYFEDSKIVRVTDHRLIDTEPSWSPDGRHIVFTSNRGKGPQIYRANASRSARAKRVTLEGRSNSGAQYSPSGEQLVVITDQGSGNQVAIYELNSKQLRIISKTVLDDSARFSPNGDMLIHVVEGKDRYIKILSPDGRVQTRIPVEKGLVKQVDWGSIQR